MTNLYFTICAFFVAILLIIDFFTKKRIKNNETSIFSKMLITSFIDTVLSYFILLIGYISRESTTLIVTLNKLDFLQYLLWGWYLFLYIFYITYKNNLKISSKYPKVYKITKFINIMIYIGIAILPTYLHFAGGKWYAYGPSVNLLYVVCCIYVVLIALCVLLNIKNIKDRKYSPLFVLLGIAIILLILRQNSPQLLVIPAVLTYINLIMYFTIENPDLKLLEEIKKSKEEVDKINIDKSNFLFNITEDTKKNLNQIDDYIDISLMETDAKIIKENLYEIKNIINSSERAINNTLDISEEDARKIRKIDNKYNIKNIIKELIIQTQVKVDKNVDFRTEIENNLPEYLYGDSVKLKQILITLLDNSTSNTKEGFIELKVNSVTKYNICRLIISIEDSGNGIDSKVVENIFNNNATNDDFMAKNLNLKTVNKIIHLIGGTFNITSRLNYGTKVTVTLDQIIDDTASSKLSQYINDLNFAKVLIISEDLDNTNKIKRFFNKNEINIETVTSGEQGLIKIRNNEKYNLIIVDYDLSKLSGLNTYMKLRKINKFNALVVMIIDKENKELEERYKEIGLYKIIKKPIKISDIKNLALILNKRK